MIKIKKLIVPPLLMLFGITVSKSGDLSNFGPVSDAMGIIGELSYTILCIFAAILSAYIAAEVSSLVNPRSATAIALSATITGAVSYSFLIVLLSILIKSLQQVSVTIYIIYIILIIGIYFMANRRVSSARADGGN